MEFVVKNATGAAIAYALPDSITEAIRRFGEPALFELVTTELKKRVKKLAKAADIYDLRDEVVLPKPPNQTDALREQLRLLSPEVIRDLIAELKLEGGDHG